MGCGGSTDNGATPEEVAVSRAIDQQLKKEKAAMQGNVKILLLGAGESGKSTIAKQMKIIYLKGFQAEDRAVFRDIIFLNVITVIKDLIAAARVKELKIGKKAQEKSEEIMQLDNHSPINATVGKLIKAVWEDKGIKKVLESHAEFQFLDSTEYFLASDNLERIAAEGYAPIDADILRARVKTTGITETEFHVDGNLFRMVDVGGQRSERKKWIHCFQDVTAVLFCVALSEYDLKLYEDSDTNRMHESLKLFEEICTSKWFATVSMILFLNKMDLFKEKIKKVELKVCFPDYTGQNDFDNASKYIEAQFIAVSSPKGGPQKLIYPHITCATNTDNIRVIFQAVKNILLHNTLTETGL